jgi:CheY-like chemotaxis protein
LPEPDKQGRHSIANQWGARQLAKNGEVDINENQISRALYFQLLTAGLHEDTIRKKFEEEQEKRKSSNFSVGKTAFENKFPRVNRVLLIDDNHDKGWSLVLSRLFTKWNENTETCLDPYKSFSSDCVKSLKTQEYDFVLLDFYFGESDTKGKGLKILEKIKKINPVLPVIMFTASNKAWNMDDLYEAGADGYYVKEHPDTANDSDFSIRNFNNFAYSIKNCINKGNLLKPYWKAIKTIKADSIIKEKSLSNRKTSNFKERIHERLLMFIGLLKKAFEQTEFDKGAFFYSEYELAFLTLWSTLEELQEAHFIKTQPRTGAQKSEALCELFHPNNQEIKYILSSDLKHYRWTFNDKTFIDYEYHIKGKNEFNGFYKCKGIEKSIFRFDTKKAEYGVRPVVSETEVNFRETIHMQVAFILFELNSPEHLKKNLWSLNKIRNKLYLTHGFDPNSPEFSMLYSANRKDPDRWHQHINDLFSIVYFLCTAKEWNPSN